MTKKKRFMITISDDDLIKLDKLCQVFNTKQYSKVLSILIRICDINLDGSKR